MSVHQSLEDSFISELLKEKISVSVFLMNGIKLHGIIDGFDSQVVMLKSAVTQMVYKHAISTVVPVKMITLSKN